MRKSNASDPHNDMELMCAKRRGSYYESMDKHNNPEFKKQTLPCAATKARIPRAIIMARSECQQSTLHYMTGFNLPSNDPKDTYFHRASATKLLITMRENSWKLHVTYYFYVSYIFCLTPNSVSNNEAKVQNVA